VATAAELARALRPLAPDPGVWQAVEARTGLLRPRFSARVGPVGWAALATAAALALVSLQVERVETRRQREAAGRAAEVARAAEAERDRLRAALLAAEGEAALRGAALALLERPDSRLVRLAPQPGQAAGATAIVNLAAARAVVVSALPPRPGHSYQLWVIRGAAPPRPAGFLKVGAGGAVGEIDPALLSGGAPDALAVSLEPEGGSPSPTQVLAVGKLAG